MNKQIEALKMLDDWLDDYTPDEVRKALQEALAEAEKQEIGEAEIRQMLKEIEWCHQELEKIEKQEPVACSGKYGCKCDKHYTHPATWQSLSDDEIEYWECLKAPPVHPDFVDDDSWHGFARAIEQRLKELNAKK